MTATKPSRGSRSSTKCPSTNGRRRSSVSADGRAPPVRGGLGGDPALAGLLGWLGGRASDGSDGGGLRPRGRGSSSNREGRRSTTATPYSAAMPAAITTASFQAALSRASRVSGSVTRSHHPARQQRKVGNGARSADHRGGELGQALRGADQHLRPETVGRERRVPVSTPGAPPGLAAAPAAGAVPPPAAAAGAEPGAAAGEAAGAVWASASSTEITCARLASSRSASSARLGLGPGRRRDRRGRRRGRAGFGVGGGLRAGRRWPGRANCARAPPIEAAGEHGDEQDAFHRAVRSRGTPRCQSRRALNNRHVADARRIGPRFGTPPRDRHHTRSS